MIPKNISRKTIVQLTYIIKSVLKLNNFPDQYKTAIQFWFKNHDTTQQIARISNDILLNFNQDKKAVFTLLDIEIVIYVILVSPVGYL
jgi:hypothetical protein